MKTTKQDWTILSVFTIIPTAIIIGVVPIRSKIVAYDGFNNNGYFVPFMAVAVLCACITAYIAFMSGKSRFFALKEVPRLTIITSFFGLVVTTMPIIQYGGDMKFHITEYLIPLSLVLMLFQATKTLFKNRA